MTSSLLRRIVRARLRDWLLALLAAEALCALGGLGLAHVLPIAGDYLFNAHDRSPYAALEGNCRPVVRWAYTDQGRPIRISRCEIPPPAERDFQAEDAWLHEQALDGIVIRTGNPGPHSNCFGWAFTGGRFAIDDDIHAILEDNAYEEVAQPGPGDLVVYDLDGSIFHVGIVRGVDSDGEAVVESKWGARARYHHPVRAYPAPAGYVCTFYRSPRQGHLLKGVYE